MLSSIPDYLRKLASIELDNMPKIIEYPDTHIKNPDKEVLSTDYDFLSTKIRALLKNYKENIFGNEKQILFYTPKKLKPSLRNILIMSGCHGEEPAGPWSILKFLRDHPDSLDKANVSFMPVVSEWGFRNHRRTTPSGRAVNHLLNETKDTFLKELSDEAQIVKDNINLISKYASEGVLSLHEDNTSQGYYLYFLGDTEENKDLIGKIKRVGFKKFGFKKNGLYTDNGEYELKEGLVDNHFDGTIEYTLFKKYGSKLAITSETPSKEVDINERIQVGSRVINSFVTYIG